MRRLDRIFSFTVTFSSYTEMEAARELLAGLDCIVREPGPEADTPDADRSGTILNAMPHHGLDENITPREKEVLLLLAKGFSYAESAEFLGCTVSTVQTHVKRLYRKLEVNSKAEAVYEALHYKIIEL